MKRFISLFTILLFYTLLSNNRFDVRGFQQNQLHSININASVSVAKLTEQSAESATKKLDEFTSFNKFRVKLTFQLFTLKFIQSYQYLTHAHYEYIQARAPPSSVT